ncbi:MAG: helix-turn-helix transcriptional regulator [Acidobacteriota bacterium]
MAEDKTITSEAYLKVISQNVRRLRGAMSQAEFAQKAGISSSTVHRIESRKNFNVDSLLKIAVACGLYPYEICMSEGDRRRIQTDPGVLMGSLRESLKKEILAELKRDSPSGAR